MSGTFLVAADPARNLLSITLRGFFDLDGVAALRRERDRAFRELSGAPNSHVTLCDVSACAIQPQDVVAGFADVIAEPGKMARRLAFVTGSSLSRMQVRRLAQRDNVRIFDTRPMAEAWLFDEAAALSPNCAARSRSR